MQSDEAPSRARIGKPDWDTLIPGLKTYFAPGPTQPQDWAFCESSIEAAIGFSELFWPPFAEYDGMVFKGKVGPEGSASIAGWMDQFEGDKSEVEKMLNHEHLIDLFDARNSPTQPEKLAYLGAVVCDMWLAKLKTDFPEKAFTVELFTNPVDGIGDWLITFYQRPPLPRNT